MNTIQKITSLNLPERLKQNAYKQINNKKESNLVINAGTDTGLGQELCKTLTALMDAEPGHVILFKDHDSIEEKLQHNNYPHEFAWVKGLERFLNDNYPHILEEKEINKMFEFGIPNSVIKGHLPENIVEEYEEQIPVDEDGNLTQPVLTVYNFLEHPDIKEGADKIVWEENPHKPDTSDITLSFEEFADLAQEHVKGSVPKDLWEQFYYDLNSFMPNWDYARHTFDYTEVNQRKIRYTKSDNEWDFNADEYVHNVLDRSFGNFDVAGIVLKYLNENGEEGQQKLTGKIAEAVNEDDLATASKISELLRNIRALQDFSETDRILANFKIDDGMEKGVNPFTGKASYMTTWKQYINKLEDVDANVQVNYAEATRELIDIATEGYEWMTISSDKPVCNLTALVHDKRGGSYAKSKMKKSEKKRQVPESIAKCFEEQGKKVGMVTYSKFVHEGKYRDTDYPSLYFGNFKGKNSLDDRDVLLVVGSPNKPWYSLAIEHLLHHRQFPEFSLTWDEESGLQVDEETIETSQTIEEFKERSLNLIYTHQVKKELRDASQRLRGQRDDEDKHLVMLGFCPDIIWENYPEEKRNRTDAHDFLAEQLQETVSGRDEVPEAIRELPFTPNNNLLPEGLYQNDGVLLTTSNKEGEIVDDLKELGRMEWGVAKEYYGQTHHTRQVIKESELLEFEGSRNNRFVTLQ